MDFSNALVYGPDFEFHRTGFSMENGVFSQLGSEKPGATDLEGQIVLPGLVDIHTHGNSGHQFDDAGPDALAAMTRCYAQHGTTTVCATTTSRPLAQLAQACQNAAAFAQNGPADAAALRGVTLEGPFLSPAKKGGMLEKYLLPPDIAGYRRLAAACCGLPHIVCVAPELPGAMAFIAAARHSAVVALAHTTADYETAAAALAVGAGHLTHLYNAMPPLNHRGPGPIAAAVDVPNAIAELICDGIHVHPAAVRAAFRLFGAGRIILISDSVRWCGLPGGEYAEDGRTVTVLDGRITLPDGTLCGSGAFLLDCLRRCIAFGIPAQQAIRCATCNPARRLGMDGTVGSIAPGMAADFLVCDHDYAEYYAAREHSSRKKRATITVK